MGARMRDGGDWGARTSGATRGCVGGPALGARAVEWTHPPDEDRGPAVGGGGVRLGLSVGLAMGPRSAERGEYATAHPATASSIRTRERREIG